MAPPVSAGEAVAGHAPGVGPRLIILYATCSLNKDYLSPYSPDIVYTPHLKQFAAEGRVFERHQTESGQSGVAYASIMTGTQANRHGIYHHPNRLRDNRLVLTEAFAERGYEVHTWLSHQMASAELGYAQGVPAGNVHPQRLDAEDPAFRALLERLNKEPELRVLVVTNFTVTHSPYATWSRLPFCEQAPEDCLIKGTLMDHFRYSLIFKRNANRLSYRHPETMKILGKRKGIEIELLREIIELNYKIGVFRLDRLVGELISLLREHRLYDESLVVFTADHGEILYRENAVLKWTHGFQLAPEVLGVPLIIRGPGIEPGRYSQVTRSIDLLPTLIGLAGLPPLPAPFGVSPDDHTVGRDLSASFRGKAKAPELIALSHTAIGSKLMHEKTRQTYMQVSSEASGIWIASRERDLFLTYRPRKSKRYEPALFDLKLDPGVANDIYSQNKRAMSARVEALLEYKQQLVAGFRDWQAESPGAGVDQATEEDLLRSLGYIE